MRCRVALVDEEGEAKGHYVLPRVKFRSHLNQC